ncbi:hypothetical protein IA57_07135 [Mangrovimonas yunxiaonensis]|uniref:NIPSNAP family containing protein n=1 Tax=Mangrovimonas yunxiaonensis TaxID=1197477 RepID=A0A084TLL0_9FLAO|nr:hypothetical protein [Mangrovimonas yunxiaonensis]KFB01596.1 hypothetical protein IA57_07135 [Mangrovimonas yunxiaonensis]GGH35753.1 hypothetical protein GCM10011364_02520 [Mangrovimonas yunxiaonensis]
MKTNQHVLAAILTVLLLFTAPVLSQDEQTRPEFVVVTTMHRNMDNDDFDREEWLATEKEFVDKVIRKNDHIVTYGVYPHLFTDDNTEILFVRVYRTWNDILLAAEKNGEFIESGWPDKAKREAFFEKRAKYYSPVHSDEIYGTMDHAKLFEGDMTDDTVIYVRKNYFAFPEDGSFEEFDKFNSEFVQNVFYKNEYIKGYYPHSHRYGANSSDFIEAFYLDSLDNLGKMFDRNDELTKAYYNEARRKELGKKSRKYFTGVHADALYSVVPELRK